MKNVLILLCFLFSQNPVLAPINYYHKQKYEHEDRLIESSGGGSSFRTGQQEYTPPGRKTSWGTDLQPPGRGSSWGQQGSDSLGSGFPHVYTDSQLESPVLAQALNFRLPQLPRKLPSLPSNYTINIYAVQGTTVVLPCRVFNLGSATLAWIRRPSLTVLSHGSILFSSSNRLKLLHSFGSPDWNLQISKLELEDSGIYECQVNTEPKLSRSVNLDVRVPDTGQDMSVPALALQGGWQQPNQRRQRTEILAPPEVRVLEGGSIGLECVVTEHNEPPQFFTWYIGETALDFHQHRGGVLLEEERRLKSSSSKLTITRLQVNESAVYTCSPELADSASVRVTVFSETAKIRSGQNPVYSSLPVLIAASLVSTYSVCVNH